jgi:BASS family bile acid:Na+ symporter
MDIDLIRLNINETSINVLKVIIAFLMYAIALELKLSDFKTLFAKPKALLVGLSLQFVFFPILTVLFIQLFDLRASIALGLIMIAASPIGNLANLMTTLAKGNLALSVGLTSFTNLISLITAPLFIIYLGQFNEATAQYLKTIHLDQKEILEGVFIVLGIPVLLGMLTSYYRPRLATKIQQKMKKVSSAFLILFVLSALAVNFQHFLNHVKEIFSITFAYHLLTIVISIILLKITNINYTNVKSILITGIMKNSGLAFSLTLQFFPSLGGMALLVAFATISQLITGFLIVKIFNSKSNLMQKWNKI